ncbi:hypothetical protein Bbelb_306160 [Branchiostoma belcheri]|nr:hypothetical protein Bbelb_306160 [Branchiostoma belcheri]
MSRGQQQSQAQDTRGNAPMQQPQTDWRSVADAAATIPNPLYARSADVKRDANYDAHAKKEKCRRLRKKLWQTAGLLVSLVIIIAVSYLAVKVSSHSEEIAKLSEIIKLNRRTGGRSVKPQVHPEEKGEDGLAGPPGEKGARRVSAPPGFVPGLLDLLDLRGQLDPKDKKEQWGQLALGRPGSLDLQEKRVLRGQLDPKEKKEQRGQLDRPGSLDLQEKKEIWGQLTMGLSGLLDFLERQTRSLSNQSAQWTSNIWSKWGRACYKSFVGIGRKTFSDAMKICRKDGGTLAMPRDNDTTAFLISKVHRGFAYWIGLHDQREEGTFEWVDGSGLCDCHSAPQGDLDTTFPKPFTPGWSEESSAKCLSQGHNVGAHVQTCPGYISGSNQGIAVP